MRNPRFLLRAAALALGCVSLQAARSDGPRKFPDAGCTLEMHPDSITFGNALGKIVWTKSNTGWVATFHADTPSGWKLVAYDKGIGIQFPDSKRGWTIHKDGPIGMEGGYIPPTAKVHVLEKTPVRITLQWTYDLLDSKRQHWPVVNTYRVRRGDRYIHETVSFREIPPHNKVRLQREWAARDFDPNEEFFAYSVNSPTHKGFMQNGASFLVVIDPGKGWTETSGGGGMIHWGLNTGFKIVWDVGRWIPQAGAEYRMAHRAPAQVDDIGWLDTDKTREYTLAHYLMFWPGVLYERAAIDYLHQISPPQRLPLRYSWKTFMDKQVEGRKHEVPGEFIDNGRWGYHVAEGWYGYTDECPWKGREKGSGPFLLLGRPTLDWGGTWDLWTGLGLYEYGTRYNDKWSTERAIKIFNSAKEMKFQVEAPGFWADGAIWMYAALTQDNYAARKRSTASRHGGWTHQQTPVHKDANYGFYQTTDTPGCNDLWVCDTGKIGYWLADLSMKLHRPDYLEMARKAADFLLRVQREDGNLKGGRFHISGTLIYDSNLATNSCAMLLWAKLYEITHEEKYLTAAKRDAEYTVVHFLNGRKWLCNGGEWDASANIDNSSGAYAALAFSILYRASGEKFGPALNGAKRAADFMVAGQALFDTNIGAYHPFKAKFLGRDVKTTGGMIQANPPAGYGQLLWVRPEPPLALYYTWKATGDKLYRDAAIAYLVWMQYMQHTDSSDYRFYGTTSEGLELNVDWMNGFGCTYVAGPFGCDVTLARLIEDGILTGK